MMEGPVTIATHILEPRITTRNAKLMIVQQIKSYNMMEDVNRAHQDRDLMDLREVVLPRTAASLDLLILLISFEHMSKYQLIYLNLRNK